jgi:signal transduction histidine kinase
MLAPLNFRLRMMLLFCFVIGALMAATSATVNSIFVKAIRAELDRRLMDAAPPLVADLSVDPQKAGSAEDNPSSQRWLVFEESGQLLNRSRNTDSTLTSVGAMPDTRSLQFRDLSSARGRLRAALVPFESNHHPLWLVVVQSTAEIEYSEWRFRDTLFGIWVLSLLLTAAIAAWYVGRALRPITDLTRHASALTEKISDSGQTGPMGPLPITNPDDEVGQLANSFNMLFNRVDAVVRQLRQFVSDASHELRTPLSVLRGETHYLIEHERSPREYQTALRVIDSELAVLTRIVDGLFTLSMADAGQLRLSAEPLYLDEVLEEACGIAAPGARRKNIRIERLAWNEIPFVGDQALLRQLFLIVLENAIKYSSPSTVIRVRIELIEGRPCVTVSDQGIGIAPEHLSHIFERFYRAASDPNEDSKSGGLGLAIAQAIVRSHHGTIECRSIEGEGSTFILWFPSETAVPSAARVAKLV